MRKFPHQYNLFSLRKRILALIVIISLLFFAVNIRLGYIAVSKSRELNMKAQEQWSRDLTLAAERGKIFDCNGNALAVSYTSYDIYVRAKEVSEPEKVAKFLNQTLNVDYDKTLAKCKNKSISESLIKLSVEDSIARQIQTAELAGVYLAENIKRYYPYGDMLTQVLGFMSIDGRGQAGLEAYYNNYLKGQAGSYLMQSDLVGRELDNKNDIYLPSLAGMNLTLTINSKIQLICEQVLMQVMSDHKPKSATAIIMEPSTGKILAMSTKPSYDLNELPRDDVQKLMEMTKNKSVVDVYEPGSTFKILTVASALEEGLTSLDERFYDPGYRMVDGQKIKCWKTIGHGSETLIDGFVNSCNSVFMDLALRLGTNRLYDYLNRFGIGQQTGVDISGESAGLLIKEDNVKNVDLARIGFGQSVAVTPLQILTAFCSAINGGRLMSPHLVSQITDKDGNIIATQPSQEIRNTISKSTSDKINTLLLAQATKNGKTSFIEGYNLGTKTGTAQKYENGVIARGKYISSIFATYPAEQPKYALLLLVDEPSQGQYYGSVVAAPYAKMIYEKLFHELEIPKSDTQEKERKEVIMPNCVGLSLSDALVLLKNLKLDVEIDGDGMVVVNQFPPEGTILFEYQTVVIKTNSS